MTSNPKTPDSSGSSQALRFDYARLTGSGEAGVPFSSHAGVVIEDAGPDGATARLDAAPETLNHVGSVHGGALFTVGGAAAGAAVAGAFGPGLEERFAVARRAEIDFLKVALGTVRARAVLLDEMEGVAEALAASGSAAFRVGVTVSNTDGEIVARLVFFWSLKPPRTPPA